MVIVLGNRIILELVYLKTFPEYVNMSTPIMMLVYITITLWSKQ